MSVLTGLEKNEKSDFVEVVKKDTQKAKNALHSRQKNGTI
jgi:hypothetical protein